MLTKTGGAEIHAFFALDERQRTTASNLSRVAGFFVLLIGRVTADR
jgi:hypothetical protein